MLAILPWRILGKLVVFEFSKERWLVAYGSTEP